MHQCILNVPMWNNWSKVTYSQVHGSPVLKALLLQSFQWISATRFPELIQFWQDQNVGVPELSQGKIQCFIGERFHIFFHIYFSARFAFYFLEQFFIQEAYLEPSQAPVVEQFCKYS